MQILKTTIFMYIQFSCIDLKVITLAYKVWIEQPTLFPSYWTNSLFFVQNFKCFAVLLYSVLLNKLFSVKLYSC